MDRISRLPDDVLSHILSFLPTKHAVGTSVLSSRWLTLWYFVTVIDLDDTLYFNSSSIAEGNTELFIRFIDRVMSLNQSQTILKFQLRMGSCFNYGGQTLSKINGFIQNVISRNVVELVLDIRPDDDDDDDDDCLKIPHSESLKVLDVSAKGCRLKMPSFPGCFPSLRVFNVYVPPQEDDEWMTKLFPCLPALYADIAERTGPFNFNIGGPALTHLELELLVNSYDRCDAMVVIDAPKLDYLMLRDGFMASYLVKHKPAISEVRLHVGEEENGSFFILSEVDPTRLTRFDELLRGLVNTKFLRVYATQLQLVSAQNGNLPLLPYLTKLELHVTAMSWILVLHWLQSCPNLKVLSVIISDFPPYKFKEAVPDFVPLCLSSCIKEIEIKKHGKVELEKMLIYLLDNAKVLDNLTVDSHVYIKDGISHVVG